MKNKHIRGYTLIELVIAVGLFALIMTLASGAYLVMIGISRQTQGITTGIDTLAFALETMTRTIRTNTGYSCGVSGDCPGGGDSFSVVNASGVEIRYRLLNNAITQTKDSDNIEVSLTDLSVNVTSLTFYASGTVSGDDAQPRVTIIVSGWIPSGSGEKKEYFYVETGATMRGTDI